MRKLLTLSLMFCLTSCVKNTVEQNPSTIKLLLDRIEACSHFAGEIGGDNSDRDKEVNTEMAKLKCDSLVNEVDAAKVKYKDNPEILKAIGQAVAIQ